MDVKLKRLTYRSWHRGCKETDLVLGPFADSQLSTLSQPMVDLYEALLDEDDADIWAWLTAGGAPLKYEPILALLQSTPMSNNG